MFPIGFGFTAQSLVSGDFVSIAGRKTAWPLDGLSHVPAIGSALPMMQNPLFYGA
jgi:hypothetical protein